MWRGVGSEVADEIAVVAGQPQETMRAPWGAGSRPGRDSGHLVPVHRDTIDGDGVTEVSDRDCLGGALRVLQVEAVCLQGVEDEADALEVLGPRRAINENIAEENQHAPAKKGRENIVHKCLERSWGI